MSQSQSEPVKFEGEDPNSGFAAPGLDLAAAAFLIALSILIMVASINLPMPGALQTAPGLLPFLTAAALGIMALMLGASALKRRRMGIVMDEAEKRDIPEDRRVLLLAASVGIYIFALQTLAFQLYFSVASVSLVLSAFEPVTIIALASIIHVSWRGPLWITALVSVCWTLTLSLVFQKLFLIPLPGGF